MPMILVLVLVFSSVTEALKCYRCDRLSHPKDCEHLVECGQNEACYVEGNVTDAGRLQYTSGCLSNSTCNAVLHTDFGQQDIIGKRDLSFCRICCDKDFCNNELCDKTEIIGTVGPRCMNCKYIDDPRKCLQEIQCRNEETCYTKQSEITTKPYYEMGCVHKRDCQLGSSLQSQPLVGRSTGATCSQCCIGDHCNLHLCTDESVVNAYHLFISPTPSTTCDDLNQEMCNFMVNIQGQSCSNSNIVRMCKKTCNNCESDNCRDTTDFDCAIVARYFNICDDIQSARAKCPMFCNYCNPVDGSWSSWSSWTKCISKFGNETGLQSRTRRCGNPAPSHGGNPCSGDDTDTSNCTSSVDGGWSEWSSWAECDSTCEYRNKTRNRTCDNPVPINGLDCDGNSTETIECPCTGVRLRGGNSTSGRVEVYYNGKWGTTCDDIWNVANARVVCRMLGFSNGTAQVGGDYGPGTGQILLDDVNCSGQEISIFQCIHTAWGVHNCGHSEDAGVSCF